MWTSLISAWTLCSAEHKGRLFESNRRIKSCSCPQKEEDRLELRGSFLRDTEAIIYNVEMLFETGRRHEIWSQVDQVQIPALPFSTYVMSDKLLNLAG